MPATRNATSTTAQTTGRQARPIVSIGPARARQTRSSISLSAPLARDSAPRVLLPVTLEGSADYLCAQRRALLRSPLGVYVSHIDAHRARMAVWFDLARADVSFAIHTLLTTVPDATLGCLRPRLS
ncbi:hypothetical protein ACS0ZG_10590 [Burkholderia gladioli]|uniref:hypothetical protein n=1 Tax=Burkholderia gladioli TaxID=28095 RepID=UPI00069CE0FC|nr:hypothetical protein [Burkholderia gladioli]POS05834.1 hypothetical protein C3Y08_27995 [Burkholderia gladioli]